VVFECDRGDEEEILIKKMNLKSFIYDIYKMNYLTQNDIYFHTQIRRRISLNPKFLDVNFTTYIEKIEKSNLEGKCVREGYVVPGTVVILERSMGNLNNNQFNGNVLFDVVVGAKVCNIPVNSVVKAAVKKINKVGILAELGPLIIMVPREIHRMVDIFRDVKVGSEVEILVIGKTYELDSKKISVYGKLNEETKKKIKIKPRVGKSKTKNTDNKIVNETIMPQEEGYDERTKESEEALERFEEDEGTELEDDIAEATIEDESELEDELDEEGEEGELDAELIDNEGSLEDADELMDEMDEPFEDEDEEEEEEIED